MCTREEIIRLIDADRENMLKLWQELVNTDCGFDYKEGVDGVAAKIGKILEGMGFITREIPCEKAGNVLIGELGDMSKPFIVLTGHMDTVFPVGEAARRPFTIKDGRAYGPSVLDMKGGIVIFLSALKAVLALGWKRHPVKVILAGDEEPAHAYSDTAEYIMQESKGAFAAFNFETGFMDNGLVIERKGSYRFIVEVFGRGAHVGNDPENGRSAIKEMAYKILDIEALNAPEKDIAVNVGIIEGGTVCNAVPAYAKITCDMRYKNRDAVAMVKEKLAEIAKKQYVPDTKTVVTDLVNFWNMQPLPGTAALLKVVQDAAADIGLPVPHGKAVGGGSDSAYITAVGVPAVCAFGVRGGRNHTPEEFADVESLFERTKIFANVLRII